MRFEEVLPAMREGRKAKCGTAGEDHWKILNGIMYHMSDSGFGAGYSVPSDRELLSDEWRLVDDTEVAR